MRFGAWLTIAGFWCAACGDGEASFAPAADAGSDQAAGSGGSGGGSGSSGSAGSGGASAATGAGGTAGASGSGGAGGSSGAGGGGGSVGDGPFAGDGYIFVQQSETDYRLNASFDVWQPSPLCSYRSSGPCRIERCTPPTVRADAGEVGVSVGAVRQVAASTGQGMYGDSWPGQLWQPGQAVQLFASGNEAPAIDETVTAPADFTLLEPDTSPGSIAVSGTQGLFVRWSGGDNGAAVVAFAGRTAMNESLQSKCSFDAALGQGQVPADALAELDPEQTTQFLTFAESYVRKDIEGWLIRVGVRTPASVATVAFQ